MDSDRFIQELRMRIEEAGSQKAFAEAVGISEPYLSDILAGRREPGEKILKPLGLQRKVIYEEVH